MWMGDRAWPSGSAPPPRRVRGASHAGRTPAGPRSAARVLPPGENSPYPSLSSLLSLSGLAGALGRSGRGAPKSGAPGWGAGRCKISGALNFQKLFWVTRVTRGSWRTGEALGARGPGARPGRWALVSAPQRPYGGCCDEAAPPLVQEEPEREESKDRGLTTCRDKPSSIIGRGIPQGAQSSAGHCRSSVGPQVRPSGGPAVGCRSLELNARSPSLQAPAGTEHWAPPASGPCLCPSRASRAESAYHRQLDNEAQLWLPRPELGQLTH